MHGEASPGEQMPMPQMGEMPFPKMSMPSMGEDMEMPPNFTMDGLFEMGKWANLLTCIGNMPISIKLYLGNMSSIL